jgi:phosphoribosylformimino-5-aminoimidazole carboxamide ribotide isomerase
MELWPAIDLRDGRCVRLLQGDYDRETVFGDDPIAMALSFVAAGARRLHLVDLDGAKAGRPIQADLVGRVVEAVRVPCQIGGGIRSEATAATYLDVGVDRVVVGSLAIRDPDTFSAIAMRHPGHIVLGLDAREGMVAVDGWTETSSLPAVDVAHRLAGLPLAGIVFTDIARDGTLEGPNLTALREMVEAVALPVVASGGVATVTDIQRVAQIRARGCIVGRAIYAGTVDLAEAIQVAGDTA